MLGFTCLGLSLILTSHLAISKMSWFETPQALPEPEVYVRPNPEALVFRLFTQLRKTEFDGKTKMPYGKIDPVGTVFKMAYRRRIVLVTAGHVCEMVKPEMNLLVETYGTAGLIFKQVKILKYSRHEDICILSMPSSGNTVSYLEASPDDVRVGDFVEKVGYPMQNGTYKIRSSGVVTGFLTETQEFFYIFVGNTDMTLIPGESGSPLLNDKGQVVGIMIICTEDGSSSRFVPISFVKAYIDKEILHGQ